MESAASSLSHHGRVGDNKPDTSVAAAAAAAASVAATTFVGRMDDVLQREGPHGVLQLLLDQRDSCLGGAVDWFHEHVTVLFHALQCCRSHPKLVSQVYTITKMDTFEVSFRDEDDRIVVAAECKCRNANHNNKSIRSINGWVTNHDLQRLYITCGGRIYPALQYSTLQTNRELALLVARYNPMEVDLIGHGIVQDVDFWRQAVTINGLCLRYAPLNMHTNLELAVLSIAQSHVHAIQPVHRWYQSPNYRVGPLDIPDTMAEVVTRTTVATCVQEQLKQHQIVQVVLGGSSVCLVLPPALKQLIASFVGIPTGTLLMAYQTCHAMLNSLVDDDDDSATEGFIPPLPNQPVSIQVHNDDTLSIRILDRQHRPFWDEVNQWQGICRDRLV